MKRKVFSIPAIELGQTGSSSCLREVDHRTGSAAIVGGFYESGDGGGGVFIWTDDITTPDDGGIVIVPRSKSPALGPWVAPTSRTGCWKRVESDGRFNVRWFGAKGDGAHDDTATISVAWQALMSRRKDGLGGGGVLYFPRGTYVTTKTISLPGGLTIEGDGANVTDQLSWFAGDGTMRAWYLRPILFQGSWIKYTGSQYCIDTSATYYYKTDQSLGGDCIRNIGLIGTFVDGTYGIQHNATGEDPNKTYQCLRQLYENVFIVGFDVGFRCNCEEGCFLKMYFTGCNIGVWLQDNGTGETNDNRFYDLNCHVCQTGLLAHHGLRNSIYGATFQGNGLPVDEKGNVVDLPHSTDITKGAIAIIGKGGSARGVSRLLIDSVYCEANAHTIQIDPTDGPATNIRFSNFYIADETGFGPNDRGFDGDATISGTSGPATQICFGPSYNAYRAGINIGQQAFDCVIDIATAVNCLVDEGTRTVQLGNTVFGLSPCTAGKHLTGFYKPNQLGATESWVGPLNVTRGQTESPVLKAEAGRTTTSNDDGYVVAIPGFDYTIGPNECISVTARVMAVEATPGGTGYYTGVIRASYRGSGPGGPAITIEDPNVLESHTNCGASATIVLIGSSVNVQVTGPTGKSMNWSAWREIVAVQ